MIKHPLRSSDVDEWLCSGQPTQQDLKSDSAYAAPGLDIKPDFAIKQSVKPPSIPPDDLKL